MPVETTGSTLVTDIGCLVGERNQSERCPRNAASCLRAQPTTFMEQPSNEPTGFANLQRRGCVHPRRLVSRSSLWSIVVCAVEREREREEKKKKKKKPRPVAAPWIRRGRLSPPQKAETAGSASVPQCNTVDQQHSYGMAAEQLALSLSLSLSLCAIYMYRSTGRRFLVYLGSSRTMRRPDAHDRQHRRLPGVSTGTLLAIENPRRWNRGCGRIGGGGDDDEETNAATQTKPVCSIAVGTWSQQRLVVVVTITDVPASGVSSN